MAGGRPALRRICLGASEGLEAAWQRAHPPNDCREHLEHRHARSMWSSPRVSARDASGVICADRDISSSYRG